jgi:E3 ubiquitin-protein ligase UBR4
VPLITSIITYSGSEVKEAVAVTLLEALVPMASELLTSCQGAGFPQLMIVMSTLADAGSGKGHVTLFVAATWWISIW